MKMVEVDNKPHLCLFALKDLVPGTELRYDYGDGNYAWRIKVRMHCFLRKKR